MPEFQRLGGHDGANGDSGSVPDGHRYIPPVSTLGGASQKELEPGEVCRCDLFGYRELIQESIDGVHVESRH